MLRRTAPLYHQLKELLTEKIEGGLWEPGHRLPAEKDLSAEFGVSRATVRQAMQFLEFQGLVERVQGLGTFVSRPKVAHNLLSIGNGDFSGGGVSSIQIHQVVKIPAPASVASRLSLAPGETTYEVMRSVLEANEPLATITSWLPAALFPDMENNLFGGSIRRMLLEHYATEVVHQHKEIEITILDEEEARLLKCEAGAPALLITYLSRRADGLAVELRKWIIRADRCKCFIDLETPELLV